MRVNYTQCVLLGWGGSAHSKRWWSVKLGLAKDEEDDGCVYIHSISREVKVSHLHVLIFMLWAYTHKFMHTACLLQAHDTALCARAEVRQWNQCLMERRTKVTLQSLCSWCSTSSAVGLKCLHKSTRTAEDSWSLSSWWSSQMSAQMEYAHRTPKHNK